MAEQSFLAKAGLRLGILGATGALAMMAPIATNNYNPGCNSDAARIGWYFDRTAGDENIKHVVGGVDGVLFNRQAPAGASLKLNTPSPTFTHGDGTGAPEGRIDGAVANNRNIRFRTSVAGSPFDRFQLNVGTSAESGGNAGATFGIQAADDAGASLGFVWTCNRVAFSVFNFNRPLVSNLGVITTDLPIFSQTSTWNNAGVFTAFRMVMTDTTSAADTMLADVRVNNVTRISIDKNGVVVNASVDDLTSYQYLCARTVTLTGAVTDTNQWAFTNTLNGAFTVTRYNWLTLNNPTGAATVTNAFALSFDADAGVSKCLDAGTTKTSPGTVSLWVKHNINGTIYYANGYTSKTS